MSIKDFEYNIGDLIDNLLITDRIRKLNNRGVSQKFYSYTCKICTYNGEHTESAIKQGKRCPVCAGKKVLVGYNDLWTTHPKIAKLLKNPEDGYKYSKGSNKKVDFICPDCHKENKNKTIKHMVKHGLSCCYCSDTISIPEKFMMNILDQLGIEYIYQLTRKTFEWIENYRYDFYLLKENTIIEVQGLQHLYDTGNSKFTPFDKQVEIDNIKMDLAMNNGISTYIQMDFSVSTYEYLYQAVVSSAFPFLFNIENVDFKECYKKSMKSLVVFVCDLWNKGLAIGEIIEHTKLSNDTIRVYLQQGCQIGICDYNTSESNRRANKLRNGNISLAKAQELNKRKVYCITTKEYFLSRKEALEKYPNANHISECLAGRRKTSGKDANGNRLEWRKWNEEEIRKYETTGRFSQ